MSNPKFNAEELNNEKEINLGFTKKEKVVGKGNKLFWIFTSLFALLIITIILLNTFVFFVAEVSGSSMEETLQHGDKLITNRYKEPKVDSIVTIKMGDELWIKRVVAVGGDRVEIKNGYVYVNGERKDEPYIDNKPITFLRDRDSLDITLKEDELFYLGDNRTISEDARMHGPCKVGDVVGVVENWSLWINDLLN